MSPELLNAVKERVNLGQNDDQIREELRQSGYDDDTITTVLALAKEAPADVPAAQSTTLPGVFSLIDSSVKYAFSRLDLWLLLAAPSLVVVLMQFFNGNLESDIEASGSPTLIAVSLIASLVGIVLSLMAVYIVGFSSQHKVSLADGLSWVKSNGLSLIWVGILSGLAIMGGSMLFLIPGIIVSVYLILSYLAMVREGHRGLDALMRSREMVFGNWLPVFGRLVGIWAFFIVVFIVVAFVAGFMAAFGGQVGLLIVTLLLVLGQTLLNVAGIKVGVSIYDSLQVTRPAYQPEQHKSARKKYKGLAWLGVAFPIFMIFVAIVLASLNDARSKALEMNSTFEGDFEMMIEEIEREGLEIPEELQQ